MDGTSRCRILAIVGSGETSPTMVTVHRMLVARLGTEAPSAVLLATPYAFQENAGDVSARAQVYFARSVGLAVGVLGGTQTTPGNDPADDDGLAALGDADWVFAGPGSPSYALAQWRGSTVAEVLAGRVAAGEGVTVLASAAAATMGFAAVPVYEIYKAGAAPYWLAGLDLLGAVGLKVAVIPHYDNTEGGRYDTRYCYLGERRLSLLEQNLPADAAILGVDEHTAAVFDLRAQTMDIYGRGGVTVRRAGDSTVLPPGSAISLTRLRALVRGGIAATAGIAAVATGAALPPAVPRRARPVDPPPALPDITDEARCRFESAEQSGDAAGMVTAILDLEAAIAAWAADTDEDQGTEQARSVLRGLVVRLGRAAQSGLRGPHDLLRPAVEQLITLRGALRGQGCYRTADAIRRALATAGLEIQDTSEGTRWRMRAHSRPDGWQARTFEPGS
ncbi:MAG TPA: hypothetical protein VLW50_12190 [Streptosporangiaceae bacterium]|nr:hypothetical protein [Streptosporangiaceae bacterium]